MVLLAAIFVPCIFEPVPALADTPVTIRMGGRYISAELNGSAPARELARRLPMTIRMNCLRDREYYGDPIHRCPSEQGARQQSFEDGDIAYWLRGRLLAVFFDKAMDLGLLSPVIVIGRVTSCLEVFKGLGADEEMTLEVKR